MTLAILRHHRVGQLIAVSAILLLVGTFLFSFLEQWSFIDSFYFTVSTMTTVGFGDLTVTSDVSKLLTSLYMLLSVPLLLVAIEFTVEVMYGGVPSKARKHRR